MSAGKDEDLGKPVNPETHNIVEQNGNCASYCLSAKTDDISNNFLDLNLNTDVYSDEEQSSAPVEILSEFLSTLMSRDYKSALYYCKLILQYEPNNEIVQDFYPLIQEKISLINGYESDDFADNEGNSYTKSENSTEYFFSTSAGTENNTSACSSLSSDEENILDHSQ